MTFRTQPGANPAQQEFEISNAGGGDLEWTAAAETTSGGPWLSVAPAAGRNRATIRRASPWPDSARDVIRDRFAWLPAMRWRRWSSP